MGVKDSHNYFHELLVNKFIFNDITPEDEKILEEHLLTCEICKNNIKKIERNNALFKKETVPSLSADFKKNLFDKLHIAKAKKIKVKKIKSLLLAAAIIPFIISSIISLIQVNNTIDGYLYPKEMVIERRLSFKTRPHTDETLSKHVALEFKRFLNRTKIDKLEVPSRVYVIKKPFEKSIWVERPRYYGKGGPPRGHYGKGGPPPSGYYKQVSKPGRAILYVQVREKDVPAMRAKIKAFKSFMEGRVNYKIKTIIRPLKVEKKVSYAFVPYAKAFLIFELLIRILLTLHILIAGLRLRKYLIIPSILLGTVFVPVYFILIFRKILKKG